MTTHVVGVSPADQRSESRLLKRVDLDYCGLKADSQQLAAIVDDLYECGGLYTPRANWVRFASGRFPEEVADGRPYLDEGFSEEAVEARMSTGEKMLEAWIGSQRLPITEGAVARYAPYLTAHDPLELWAANVANAEVLARYAIADLGSILDLNIIYSNSATTPERPNVVLEIGGGYGRLAEAALNVFEKAIKYVLVDSVPASLLYARDYLRQACPSARIGFYYDDDPFDLSAFDCYIAPSWHFEALNNTNYDACINIESFQEMGQEQVDTYLTWFQEIAREGALIYLSNAHDYRFQGEWNYPATWQRLLCTRIPRAWTPDHRTEVFIKTSDDHSAASAAIVAAYEFNLAQSGLPELFPRAGALTKSLHRSPQSTAKAAVHGARNAIRKRARAGKKRRERSSIFERAIAGDECAQEKFRSHWQS